MTNELITELNALLRGLAHTGRGAADHWVKASGLTRQQAFALGYIQAFQENGIIARDLADISRTSPASVTSLLNGLEQRGLIERKPSPTDSRVKLIFATEEGVAAVSGFEEDMRKAQEEAFAPLSEEELETLAGLLRRLAEHAGFENFGPAFGPEGFDPSLLDGADGRRGFPGFGGFGPGRGFGGRRGPGGGRGFGGFGGRGPHGPGPGWGRGRGPGSEGFGEHQTPEDDPAQGESRDFRDPRGFGGPGFGGPGFGGPGLGGRRRGGPFGR